jgi:hypothetical protein
VSQKHYNFLVFQGGDKHSGFLNEAKEWASELLSGQTRVRGILTSQRESKGWIPESLNIVFKIRVYLTPNQKAFK